MQKLDLLVKDHPSSNYDDPSPLSGMTGKDCDLVLIILA
jgi:hypothetical protein